MLALTDTAVSHLALEDLLRELLDRMLDVMGVDHVAILLLDEDGQTLTVQAARGVLTPVLEGLRIPVGQGFCGRIAASRSPLVENDFSCSSIVDAHPALRTVQKTLHAILGVPLQVVDPGPAGTPVNRLLGVISVGCATPRRFTEADMELLQRAADRIALAIDRARLYASEQDARQRAEAALARARASEAQAAERAERLHTILETMTDAVAVYDKAGRPVEMVNRAYHELYSLDRGPAGFEHLSTFERVNILQIRDAATGELLPFEQTPVGRALRGEVVTGPSADIRAHAFDGRELELNSSAAPLRDPDGRVAGVVLVLRNLTEHNRLARERAAARADELVAREASRRMEAFLATAAHDLRVPLSTVVGFIDLAQRKAERLTSAVGEVSSDLAVKADTVRERLDDAQQGAERLSRLLNMLFDTSALRAGKLELHRARCDLAALVRQQVEAQRMAASGRTIRLHEPAGELRGSIAVEADADRIGQVITNYLTNALKYSPPDKPVDVAVVASGSRAHVTVRDQGPGLPKEEHARVWDLYHRAPGVTQQDRALGGTHSGSLGLGLHISKAIITAHGGRVGVSSAVGQGSTFWFTLPLV